MSDKIYNYLTSGRDVDPDKFIELIRDEPDSFFRNGLEENTINVLIDFFISTDLSKAQMCLVLECVLPKTVVCREKVEKLLFWIFSCYMKDTSKAATVITWLEAMVKYNLVHVGPLEDMYGFMLQMLKFKELIQPLCNLLVLLTKPCKVTETNAYLLNKFCDTSPTDIGKLLQVYHTMKPSLVPLTQKIKKENPGQISKFEEIVKNFANKTGRKCIKNENGSLSSAVPTPEYDSNSSQCFDLKKISDIVGMHDLGQNICRIKLPADELSLLSSNEGVMYVIANGPSQKFLTSVALKLQNNPSEAFLISIVGLQEQLMHGLPPVLDYLSDFLIVWNGINRDQIVFSLIPWLHFNDFEDLKKILSPLTSVYFSSDAKVKIKIIDSLTFLITHMTCVHLERFKSEVTPRGFTDPLWLKKGKETIWSVCDVVHSLIFHGIIHEGLSCISLIETAIGFYNKLIYLQSEFGLYNFIIPPPQVIYGALFSLNHKTVSDLCNLIFNYKNNAIPCITTALGLIEDIQAQIKYIKEYASNIYYYLWGNKDAQQILDEMQDYGDYIVKQPIGIHHLGLYPVVKYISQHLKQNPDDLTKKSTLLLYESYAEGIANFIKLEMEESKDKEDHADDGSKPEDAVEESKDKEDHADDGSKPEDAVEDSEPEELDEPME